MIDFWTRLVAYQFEVALNLTRTALLMCGREAQRLTIENPTRDAAITARVDTPVSGPKSLPSQGQGMDKALSAEEAVTEGRKVKLSGSGAKKGAGRKTKTGEVTGAETAGIPGIMAFLRTVENGATVREISEHLDLERKSVLPLLKRLVREKRIDELLGRYCVLKS